MPSISIFSACPIRWRIHVGQITALLLAGQFSPRWQVNSTVGVGFRQVVAPAAAEALSFVLARSSFLAHNAASRKLLGFNGVPACPFEMGWRLPGLIDFRRRASYHFMSWRHTSLGLRPGMRTKRRHFNYDSSPSGLIAPALPACLRRFQIPGT